jgi:SAM-dependent methyltransferase
MSAGLSGESGMCPGPEADEQTKHLLHEFWQERYHRCSKIGDLALHSARTRTVSAAWMAYQDKDWETLETILSLFRSANQYFLETTLREMKPWLLGVRLIFDLYCGPGLFAKMLKELGLTVFGVEFVEELAHKAHVASGIAEVYQQPPSLALAGVENRSVDGIAMTRGGLHDPDLEIVLAESQRILRPNGRIFVTEMFKEDMPAGRGVNRGTFYRTIGWYDDRLNKMKRIYRSEKPFDNEGDRCRTVVYEKR